MKYKVILRNDITDCAIKHCRDKSAIIYFNVPLCDKHWDDLCEKSTQEMKKLLGVRK